MAIFPGPPCVVLDSQVEQWIEWKTKTCSQSIFGIPLQHFSDSYDQVRPNNNKSVRDESAKASIIKSVGDNEFGSIGTDYGVLNSSYRSCAPWKGKVILTAKRNTSMTWPTPRAPIRSMKTRPRRTCRLHFECRGPGRKAVMHFRGRHCSVLWDETFASVQTE